MLLAWRQEGRLAIKVLFQQVHVWGPNLNWSNSRKLTC